MIVLPTVYVPLREEKTQRSIILPNRIWEFVKEHFVAIGVGKVSYTEGVRCLLEEAYQKKSQ